MTAISERQRKIGALAGATYAANALLAHFLVPKTMESRLGLQADPWYRMEIGTVNAGFLYGALRLYRGDVDPTFLRSTGVSALLMAAVRTVATARGHRRGLASALVVVIDVGLGVGALILAKTTEETER